MKLLSSFAMLCLLALSYVPANGEECTSLWTADLSTQTLQPKGLSGDTNAGYALFTYRPEPHLKFLIIGSFPNARFFSFETYISRFLKGHDSTYDQKINPRFGYLNPYRMETYRPGQIYNIEVLSDAAIPAQESTNVLRLPNTLVSRLQSQTIMLRIYDPAFPLTSLDLPRIFAYDDLTGLPRSCPRRESIPFYLDFPQAVGGIAPRNEVLEFGISGSVSGNNSAVPGYSYILTKLNRDDIGLFKVKVPPTRYFSLCIHNFLGNQTLGCLPDRLLHVDSHGYVSVAFSEDHESLKLAQSYGWNILPFQRAQGQQVFGIVYRNILPQISGAYRGEFAPMGAVCRSVDFAAGICRIKE